MINTAKINKEFHLNNVVVSNAVETKDLPRHRWYYYKEGFSPSLVKEAIESYELSNDSIIVDPFNGSGTVTLTASENDIPSIGIEVNPFTSFVAKTKSLNTKPKYLADLFDLTLEAVEKGKNSPLENYSTFTVGEKKDKWLFNLEVIRAFEGGIDLLQGQKSNAAELLKLALISAIMKNANARKDGKCLRYKPHWQTLNLNKTSFIEAFQSEYAKIQTDIEQRINIKPKIITNDSRNGIQAIDQSFDLAITSPPYLNTFDYTDIYRPELFLGKFIQNSDALYNLRFKTVRSHVQVKWKQPKTNAIESLILRESYNSIKSKEEQLMDKNIPLMILAYFEDMGVIFQKLAEKANKNAHLWMVVSTSAYANEEIPVDLILADIATKNSWKLKEIGVLREISKRKTKHSPDITKLRESLIILIKS
ncbi:hypothetical protein KC799_19350 [candidate division KSB1 bacterium]|nr:hypothetical protein [candidate division KSB1 bacterium]MCB0512720.1 hypothetical protein [Bacteroidota bacterium]